MSLGPLYQVMPGDTIGSIAGMLGMSMKHGTYISCMCVKPDIHVLHVFIAVDDMPYVGSAMP